MFVCVGKLGIAVPVARGCAIVQFTVSNGVHQISKVQSAKFVLSWSEYQPVRQYQSPKTIGGGLLDVQQKTATLARLD